MGELDRPAPTEPRATADACRPATDPASEQKALREKVRREAHRQGHAEGLAAGREAGYRDGLESGRTAGRAELEAERERMLAQMSTLLDGMRQALDSLDAGIGDALVDVALAAARRLADDTLEAHPEKVLDVVRRLLREEPLYGGKPQLCLHPDDQALVETHLGPALTAAGWQLVADGTLQRGGCRVTGTEGELDATRETRWQALLAHARRTRGTAPGTGVSP